MKRLIPLWITALGGFVLIVANFIPATVGWGEVAAIWFDILAAIAFVLGGGNLLMIHLRKVSDRARGWGYSLICLVSFLGMLYLGLSKWGSPPATEQEKYGERFAHLNVEHVPDDLIFSVPGSLPKKDNGDKLPAGVRRQVREANGNIEFSGWMTTEAKGQLLDFSGELEWQCNVETLFEDSQPEEPLAGRVRFDPEFPVLTFKGHMTTEQREALLALGDGAEWVAAVNALHDATQKPTSVTVDVVPPMFASDALPGDVTYNPAEKSLTVVGPMTTDQRDDLAKLFPKARPMDAAKEAAFVSALQARGDVSAAQIGAMKKVVEGSWTVESLIKSLDDAGKPEKVDKTACEMLEERNAGAMHIDPMKIEGEGQTMNGGQIAAIRAFVDDQSKSVDDLKASLKEAGAFSGTQGKALDRFFGAVPTIGESNKAIAFAMMKAPDEDGQVSGLTEEQRDFLLADYRLQSSWRRTIGELFVAAHEVKFAWSGEYRAQGTPFWWLFEYVFKPLQATIFAMLAFYVASAAFRAFRAKNFEALLLLGTAFIILLGRTFAGVFLTAWMPDSLAGLKIENLTVYIMQVFNTAGSRAIMIGIALGIASTSLKVLLGVDRSYLGSGE